MTTSNQPQSSSNSIENDAGSAPNKLWIRGKSLLERIIGYYWQWPIIVAVLSIVCFVLGQTKSLAFYQIYIVIGLSLIFFLIGHIAAKAELNHNLITMESPKLFGEYSKLINKSEKRSKLAIKKSRKSIDSVNKFAHRIELIDERVNSFQRSIELLNSIQESVDSLKNCTHEAREKSSKVTSKVVQLEARLEEFDSYSNQISSVLKKLDKVEKSLESSIGFIQQVESLEKQIAAFSQHSNTDNYRFFQIFNRRLTEEHISVLENEWFTQLNLNLDRRALGYLAHRICLIEDICTGRLASTVEDMILRILIARSVSDQELSILEIGSLFGINLGIIYEACRGHFANIHLTAVDPLDGYYGQSLFDKITQAPISRETFDLNMRRLDIPRNDITVIQGLSTDSEVIHEAGQKKYNLLFIDGDHSYEGVKFDFDHYLDFVKENGYIVFDDYGTNWPDVAKFVDEEVMPNPDVTFVGASKRSAIFKVK